MSGINIVPQLASSVYLRLALRGLQLVLSMCLLVCLQDPVQ